MRLKYAIGIRSAGIVNAVARKFTALLRDRSGHVAMIFGIATIPLFVSVGVAVDMVQQSRVHLKLAGTADAIALAAARSYKDVDNRDAVGNRYLDANLASDYGRCARILRPDRRPYRKHAHPHRRLIHHTHKAGLPLHARSQGQSLSFEGRNRSAPLAGAGSLKL